MNSIFKPKSIEEINKAKIIFDNDVKTFLDVFFSKLYKRGFYFYSNYIDVMWIICILQQKNVIQINTNYLRLLISIKYNCSKSYAETLIKEYIFENNITEKYACYI